jgi:hypothetical protein
LFRGSRGASGIPSERKVRCQVSEGCRVRGIGWDDGIQKIDIELAGSVIHYRSLGVAGFAGLAMSRASRVSRVSRISKISRRLRRRSVGLVISSGSTSLVRSVSSPGM